MQSETGFPSSHQLKSYVAYKSRLKLAARAVLSADAGLLVIVTYGMHLLPCAQVHYDNHHGVDVHRQYHGDYHGGLVHMDEDV